MSRRHLLIAATLTVAVTRGLALARTPWEWDEMLFLHGMRDFDVAEHHPHPPGFPLFIGMGKVTAGLLGSDFRGLQSIAFIASLLLFPALFAMARSFGFDWRTAFGGALLFAFLPNVWLFGGSAFSDVPSVVLAVGAAAVLASNRIDARWFAAGCLLLGCAIAVRPQNLLFSAPLLIALWRLRARPRSLVLGLSLLALIPTASFAAAAMATGSLDRFMYAVSAHGDYIRNVDSFRSATRPSLGSVAVHFAFKWPPQLATGHVVSLLALLGAAVGLRKRSRAVFLLVATFAPFLVAAILMLDRFSATRFSIAYAPLYTLLAAYVLTELVGRFSPVAHGLVLTWLVVYWWVWLAPGLSQIRSELSPPVAALAWTSTNLSPRATLFVAEAMGPQIDYFMRGREYRLVVDERALDMRQENAPPAYLIAEGEPASGTADISFATGKPGYNALCKTTRCRYLRTFVQKMARRAIFDDRWSAARDDGSRVVRTLRGREGNIQLPGSAPRSIVALSVAPAPAVDSVDVTVLLNGQQCDRFVASARTSRTFRVSNARPDEWNTLTLRSSGSSVGETIVISGVSFGPVRPRP